MRTSRKTLPPASSFTIGVMGSGEEEHDHLARPLGELIARLGVNLLTGGGRGVMTSVSRAYTRTRRETGICIGVIPCLDAAHRHIPKPGYPNPHVELSIFTHLSYDGTNGWEERSRNHINVLSSTVIVALPGGAGTESEVELAIRYERPAFIFADDLEAVAHLHEAAVRVSSIQELEAALSSHVLARPGALAGVVGDYLPG